MGALRVRIPVWRQLVPLFAAIGVRLIAAMARWGFTASTFR